MRGWLVLWFLVVIAHGYYQHEQDIECPTSNNPADWIIRVPHPMCKDDQKQCRDQQDAKDSGVSLRRRACNCDESGKGGLGEAKSKRRRRRTSQASQKALAATKTAQVSFDAATKQKNGKKKTSAPRPSSTSQAACSPKSCRYPFTLCANIPGVKFGWSVSDNWDDEGNGWLFRTEKARQVRNYEWQRRRRGRRRRDQQGKCGTGRRRRGTKDSCGDKGNPEHIAKAIDFKTGQGLPCTVSVMDEAGGGNHAFIPKYQQAFKDKCQVDFRFGNFKFPNRLQHRVWRKDSKCFVVMEIDVNSIPGNSNSRYVVTKMRVCKRLQKDAHPTCAGQSVTMSVGTKAEKPFAAMGSQDWVTAAAITG